MSDDNKVLSAEEQKKYSRLALERIMGETLPEDGYVVYDKDGKVKELKSTSDVPKTEKKQ